MKADLNQLEIDLIAVHPLTGTGVPPELEAAFAEAYSQASKRMTVGEFYPVIASPAGVLGDAHILAYPPAGGRLAANVKVIDGRFYILDGRNMASWEVYPGFLREKTHFAFRLCYLFGYNL